MIITHELLQIYKYYEKYTVIFVIFVVVAVVVVVVIIIIIIIVVVVVVVVIILVLLRLDASSTTRGPRFRPSPAHFLFVVDKVALEDGFLRVLWFPPFHN
jgi:hypothetical protein